MLRKLQLSNQVLQGLLQLLSLLGLHRLLQLFCRLVVLVLVL
jgi:hypothetical protein